MSVEFLERALAVIERHERDEDSMFHLLDHFEGDVAVALCGFRKVPSEISHSITPECVVCAELYRNRA